MASSISQLVIQKDPARRQTKEFVYRAALVIKMMSLPQMNPMGKVSFKECPLLRARWFTKAVISSEATGAIIGITLLHCQTSCGFSALMTLPNVSKRKSPISRLLHVIDRRRDVVGIGVPTS